MQSFSTAVVKVCKYMAEGSAIRLFIKILYASLVLLGASLILCVCVIRNIIRWILTPPPFDKGK